jgi:hypothetical protein
MDQAGLDGFDAGLGGFDASVPDQVNLNNITYFSPCCFYTPFKTTLFRKKVEIIDIGFQGVKSVS